jgi:acetoin utilization deacetylase AcuC-like enzyme
VTTLLLTDALFLGHDPGEGHPERIDRLRGIQQELAVLPAGAAWGTCRDATDGEVDAVHDPALLRTLRAHAGQRAMLDADTLMSPGSFAAAVRAAGACCGLVDALLDRTADNGFALVRPPGHHATRDTAMGFCLLNNVAIAAQHARARGVERVAIVDWDVHHGNGTEHVFASRPDVLFVSTHRSPFYPGTGPARFVGDGAGAGYTVNVPLPGAMADGDYGAVFADLVVPLLAAYRPGLVLVSAGFDPHERDPMGGMHVTERGFAAMCTALRDVAKAVQAPLGLVLEGGYDVGGLSRSVRACVEVLCGASEPLTTAATARGAEALAAAQAAQKAHWRL